MVDEGLTVLLEFRKHRNGGRSQVWVGKLFVKPCEKLFSAAARRLDKMVSFAVWPPIAYRALIGRGSSPKLMVYGM
ncbi:MAG TPA: hypothetical protein V6C86_08675 [Oculatellaceae cyanobacterium]